MQIGCKKIIPPSVHTNAQCSPRANNRQLEPRRAGRGALSCDRGRLGPHALLGLRLLAVLRQRVLGQTCQRRLFSFCADGLEEDFGSHRWGRSDR